MMRSISGKAGRPRSSQAGSRPGPTANGASGAIGAPPAVAHTHATRGTAAAPAPFDPPTLKGYHHRSTAPPAAAAAASWPTEGDPAWQYTPPPVGALMSMAQQCEALAATAQPSVESFPVEPSDASSDEDSPSFPAHTPAASTAAAASPPVDTAITTAAAQRTPATSTVRRRRQAAQQRGSVAVAAAAVATPAAQPHGVGPGSGMRSDRPAAAVATSAVDIGGSWRALRSMAILALLLCSGPLLLLGRQPGLLSGLTDVFRGPLQRRGDGLGNAQEATAAATATATAAATAAAATAELAAPGSALQAAITAALAASNGAISQQPASFPASPTGSTRGSDNTLRTTATTQRGAPLIPRATGSGGVGSSSGDGGGSPEPQTSEGPPIEMVAVAGPGASPLKGAPWPEVMRHMGDRLKWTDPRFRLEVIDAADLEDPARRQALRARLSTRPPAIFAAAGIPAGSPAATLLLDATANLRTALFWDCSPDLTAAQRVDGYAPMSAGPFAKLLADKVGWSKEARAARVLGTLGELWGRHSSDDLLFTWLVVLNEYVRTVPAVANTTKGSDLGSIICMVRYCLTEIVACVKDATCKAGLDCLQACSFNDQVCQYRCIVSHETKEFGDFSLCILNKHNCRGLSAEPPKIPDPAPMTTFRGAPLTFESAMAIKHGWLQGASATGGDNSGGGSGSPAVAGSGRAWSWLVAAGKNPAYDYFPCQHQLYYTKGSASWYEPVFKVITLQGPSVWRRRKYRVRPGKTPGTFYYSVLDNGVTSDEYWRILDAADDLSFALFFYTGAASRAGMSYSGAVLGTPDGNWPTQHADRIEKALDRAGIKVWELSKVDNSACGGAPLALA